MRTWTLRMTPPDAPATTREGLSEAETLEALRRLMYGDFDAVAASHDERHERLPLSAAA